jgi:hypothetical protein
MSAFRQLRWNGTVLKKHFASAAVPPEHWRRKLVIWTTL